VHGVTELLGPFGDPATTRYQTDPAQVFANRPPGPKFNASLAGKTFGDAHEFGRRLASCRAGIRSYNDVFVFFYNRLGCLGSLLVSAVGTLLLLLLFGVLD
jgi:hypothetical protein